jgi:polygalacturonase
MEQIKHYLLVLLLCHTFGISAQQLKNNKANAEIQISPMATHVARITKDSLILVDGKTYLYTVDTPEDRGLVSTNLDVQGLFKQLKFPNNLAKTLQVTAPNGMIKTSGPIATGDHLLVKTGKDMVDKTYFIKLEPMAVGGKLSLEHYNATVNSLTDLHIYFTAGQRSPDASVHVFLPSGIDINLNNTSVNVIGRGEVKLKDLSSQSIGRAGNAYSYSKVGQVGIEKPAAGGSILTFSHLDLRPANGADLKISIRGIKINKAGTYPIRASYSTSQPEKLSSAGIGTESTILTVSNQISSLTRVAAQDLPYQDMPDRYTKLDLNWGKNPNIKQVAVLESINQGKTWKISRAMIDLQEARASISGLQKDQSYLFKLLVKDGPNRGFSNEISFHSGKIDIKSFGLSGDGQRDDTELINNAIEAIHQMGGGTLLFSSGTYLVRTVHLKSNVYLYINKSATIKALKGADAPEATWFSDKKYRSGLSPTDKGPYEDPENYLTKQDVGHHYFRNAMFFGERLNNVKIIGNGLITGNGNLVTSDKVMNNEPANRADKMFSLKLCTNLEIGGIYRPEDLWYDPEKDEPYYIGKDGTKIFDDSNMLKIDRAGHFVLLATGTDGIYVHNTYLGKASTSNARDIYDFMGCNDVTATNIYSKVSSDDIIKPGSDCSLGFTRPARNYKVRNIIGDTNCNLFQIGSETADDIEDICVDNIYVLGANKAGFSISTNDGAHISDIHLNCGHTGKLHSRSKMYRTRAPFFISISNRARILGATAGRYVFTENGIKHDELLVNNVNIGKIERIILNGIDIAEVYAGSSYGGKNERWKAYDGSQEKATPIIAGYALPAAETVVGGLNFRLPNAEHTGYISDIEFNDVHVLVKGGNPVADTANLAPELGVGQYNVANLKTQPSYGLWARHVKNLSIKNSSFNYESRDGRYPIFLDDVIGAKIKNVKVAATKGDSTVIKSKHSKDISSDSITFYDDKAGR